MGGRLDFFRIVEPLPGPLAQPWTRGRKSGRARGRVVAVVRAGCPQGAHAHAMDGACRGPISGFVGTARRNGAADLGWSAGQTPPALGELHSIVSYAMLCYAMLCYAMGELAQCVT